MPPQNQIPVPTNPVATPIAPDTILLQCRSVDYQSTRPEYRRKWPLLGKTGTLQFTSSGLLQFIADSGETLLNTRLDEVTSVTNNGMSMFLYYNGANMFNGSFGKGVYDGFTFADLGEMGAVTAATLGSGVAGVLAQQAMDNQIGLGSWVQIFQQYYPNMGVKTRDAKWTLIMGLKIFGITFGIFIVLVVIVAILGK